MEKICIIGHKSPDIDSVAAAIAYSYFKNQAESTDKYVPRTAGKINKETEYALKKFGFDVPEILDNAAGKNLILVDHNEFIQAVDGIESAKIFEILDHHKIDFKYSEPIQFEVKPWGATCTKIADKLIYSKVEMDKNLAGLLLSAILVDTVITKSPTCTEKDREIISKLSEAAGIADWQEYGMELFKIRSAVKELSTDQIIKSDFKDFNLKQGKFGIGQIETVDLNDFAGREEDLLAELNKLRESGNYHTTILFITDIIKEGSKFLVATSDQEAVEKALGAKLENNRVYIPGIISRKKQVLPKFSEVFDK